MLSQKEREFMQGTFIPESSCYRSQLKSKIVGKTAEALLDLNLILTNSGEPIKDIRDLIISQLKEFKLKLAAIPD
jgi:hypothetical protein